MYILIPILLPIVAGVILFLLPLRKQGEKQKLSLRIRTEKEILFWGKEVL